MAKSIGYEHGRGGAVCVAADRECAGRRCGRGDRCGGWRGRGGAVVGGPVRRGGWRGCGRARSVPAVG